MSERVIKVRGWDEEAEVMFYPDTEDYFIQFEDGQLKAWRIVETWGSYDEPPGHDSEEINTPLMQFTGFHDKDGKEGYYDDVVRCPVVKNPNVALRVKWNAEQGIGELVGESDGVPINLPIAVLKISIIIGNIWENPSLIKEVG